MASKSVCNETNDILALIGILEIMAEPVINDRRHEKYCEYISLFLSYFGQERSTQIDSTRGRSTLHVPLDHKIKPGLSLVDYADPKCPELRMAKHKQKKDIGRKMSRKVSKEIHVKTKKIRNAGIAINSLVQGWEELNLSREEYNMCRNSKAPIFHQAFDPLIEALTNTEDILHQTSP
ncbi:unnamed protein product [Mytilus edulis]|uniref:Uncharacterized protein n=1 Tax=Mytilus edulis TaxID=6550 RepID=A0A8S3PRS5_MYTED|nr:unnamed protein product [Mytilus edulis]